MQSHNAESTKSRKLQESGSNGSYFLTKQKPVHPLLCAFIFVFSEHKSLLKFFCFKYLGMNQVRAYNSPRTSAGGAKLQWWKTADIYYVRWQKDLPRPHRDNRSLTTLTLLPLLPHTCSRQWDFAKVGFRGRLLLTLGIRHLNVRGTSRV